MPVMMSSAPNGRSAAILLGTGIIAGTVAVAIFMVITAISLVVVSVVSGLFTAFYVADLNQTAGTVAVAAGMIITAISLIVMDVISFFRAVL